MIPVILSGGSGTRLWPLSRENCPKQFLPLVSEHSMLQETYLRLKGFNNVLAPIVICNQKHGKSVAEQLQKMELTSFDIILEPLGRNTAPAIAIAALHALSHEENPILLVLPSDHIIDNTKAFHAALQLGIEQAAQNAIVTFGIPPTSPETGYGYIRTTATTSKARKIEQFVEKPDVQTAQVYLDDGNYFWNSGMFMFNAKTMLTELETYAPDVVAHCKKAYQTQTKQEHFIQLDAHSFKDSPSISIDYAVMEKTNKAIMVPLDAGWNDVGSYEALWSVQKKNADCNYLSGNIVAVDTKSCFIHSSSKRLIATAGLENMIIIDTEDALMIVPKADSQKVKLIVDALKNKEKKELL